MALFEPRYQLSKRLFGGKSDGLRGEQNSGRIVEITLSQKEKYPSAGMKHSVMAPKIIEEHS